MRITLVHAPRPEYKGDRVCRTFIMIMPVGLLGLADLLHRDGHEVEVLHLGLARLRDPGFDLAGHLRQRRPEMVGLSLHWHQQIYDVLKAARQAREAVPGARILLGGLTASFFARELLCRFPFLDLVLRGDGERPLRRLAAGVDPGTVENLAFRRGGQVVVRPVTYAASSRELDELDFTNLELLCDADLYSARWFLQEGDTARSYSSGRIFYLCGGRGCTVSCSFCGGSREAHRLLSGRDDIALRSPGRLLDDARSAASAGYKTLYLCFDPPGIDPGHYVRFFDLVRRSGLALSMIFECYGLPTQRFLDSFAAAFDLEGSQIALSPDTADEATRWRYKGYFYTNADLLGCIESCAARGIRTTVYFTLLPGESWAEVRRLRELQQLLRDRHGCAIQTMPIEMEPAAAWHLDPQRFSIGGGPFDLDYFIERHRRIATPPGVAAPGVGYEAEEMDKMMSFLGHRES